jgi:hypothetical protein
MYIKKMIKYLFIITIVFIIIKIISQEFFDDRLFKFEKYKTSAQLEEIIKAKYPIGSNIDRAVDELRKSTAKCNIQEINNQKKYDLLAYCTYNTSFLSLHPLERYRIWFSGNTKSRVISEIDAQRISGLILITW